MASSEHEMVAMVRGLVVRLAMFATCCLEILHAEVLLVEAFSCTTSVITARSWAGLRYQRGWWETESLGEKLLVGRLEVVGESFEVFKEHAWLHRILFRVWWVCISCQALRCQQFLHQAHLALQIVKVLLSLLLLFFKPLSFLLLLSELDGENLGRRASEVVRSTQGCIALQASNLHDLGIAICINDALACTHGLQSQRLVDDLYLLLAIRHWQALSINESSVRQDLVLPLYRAMLSLKVIRYNIVLHVHFCICMLVSHVSKVVSAVAWMTRCWDLLRCGRNNIVLTRTDCRDQRGWPHLVFGGCRKHIIIIQHNELGVIVVRITRSAWSVEGRTIVDITSKTPVTH